MPFSVEVTNTNAAPIRYKTGDETNQLIEGTIDPGDSMIIDASEFTSIELRLLDVQGKHAPADDGPSLDGG